MTNAPDVVWGIRDKGNTGPKTLEQKFALLAGLIYVGIGLVGFIPTGFNDWVANTDERLLWIFQVNPFHNIIHIGVGALWLLAALVLTPPATEGVNLSIGAVYVLAGILGYIGALSLISIDIGAPLDPDNFLHVGTGLITLLFAGPLRALRRQPVGV
ncbi:MAG: DUF4383 domain-containing protein [Pseudonocardiaceae bacterium]